MQSQRITNNRLANIFIKKQVEILKKKIGTEKVILALSGGVDSFVVANLLFKAIGKNLICIHVNHGLLRKDESKKVIDLFKKTINTKLIYIDASEFFLNKLKNENDPEKKRKIIGELFIQVFVDEAKKIKDVTFLAQGTIYPDILESQKNIKSHHNVAGLPDKLSFKLVEPIKYLYKDEVRQIGLALNLHQEIIYRQPFPGPGLGVRCLGKITLERLNILRESDFILRDEIKKNNFDRKIWQYFTIIPEIKSTGIRSKKRVFGYSIIVRMVNTVDAMTADVAEIPFKILKKITNRILKEIKQVNRVVLDLTPKPCGTIEWE